MGAVPDPSPLRYGEIFWPGTLAPSESQSRPKHTQHLQSKPSHTLPPPIEPPRQTTMRFLR